MRLVIASSFPATRLTPALFVVFVRIAPSFAPDVAGTDRQSLESARLVPRVAKLDRRASARRSAVI
jgi:hypothetical protein